MPKNRKIAVIGSRAVGKSTLIAQFVEGQFSDSYYPTIENTFTKQLSAHGDDFTLEIMDTAGQDEWGIMSSSQTLGVHAYIIVYSIASKQSFDTAKVIHEKVLNYTGSSSIACVLVGNKTDLERQRQVTAAQGEELARELKCSFMESSAKLNSKIVDIFTQSIAEIIRAETGKYPSDAGGGDKCTIS
eukprot:Partr_v1_DN28475_c3_g1_i2_m41862 putative ras homolog enriched in brain